MHEPLVSILLPTYARFKNGLLQKSVESVLAQTHRRLQLIVADDASTDGSAEYLRNAAEQDERVTTIRFDHNVGLLSYTLAHAVLKAEGNFIAFAFDDTEWVPNHLEMLLQCLEENPSAAMAYGGVHVEPPGTKPIRLGSNAFDLAKLAECNYLGHSGVILRRSTVDQVGWLDPHILVKRTCDWDLWMRIGRKNLPVSYCPRLVSIENGVNQSDSLGMSVSRYDALTRKYQKTERNHFLSPASIAGDKAPMFDAFSWMNDEEKDQLRVLNFEHLLRTKRLPDLIQLSYEWLHTGNGCEKNGSVESQVGALTEAFNLYLAETRYACKQTCSSAFKLSDLKDEHRQLAVNYDRMEADLHLLETEHRKLQTQMEEFVERYNNFKKHTNEVVAARDKLEERCAKLQSMNAELQVVSDRLQSEENELRSSHNELQSFRTEFWKLQEQHLRVLSSLSWKITKPLRELGRACRGSS